MVVDDYVQAMNELAKDPDNQRWQAFMKDIMESDECGVKVERIDNEVFHLPEW